MESRSVHPQEIRILIIIFKDFFIFVSIVRGHIGVDGGRTYRKKSSRQNSWPLLLKHLSVRATPQSTHRTHDECHALSSTLKMNLSRIGLSQPAQNTWRLASLGHSTIFGRLSLVDRLVLHEVTLLLLALASPVAFGTSSTANVFFFASL